MKLNTLTFRDYTFKIILIDGKNTKDRFLKAEEICYAMPQMQ